ncbi:MAG: hypothetical protein JO057_28635 [Chloroflexi bacterium]|nr:hypothetical protein [Chloroflexota bacterium]
MDELERLVHLYRTRQAASARSKLDVLMDLERIRDPRVVAFLLRVLGDRQEREDVRIHVVRQLRNDSGIVVPSDRRVVSRALVEVLTERSLDNLRLQAALALGDFTEMECVLPALAALSLAHDESIDLRYAAFTSIERAGPTPQSTAVLLQIANDDALGSAARSVLSAWHVA